MTAGPITTARPLPGMPPPAVPRRAGTGARRRRGRQVRRQERARVWLARGRWYLTKWFRQMLAVLTHPEDAFWELKRSGDWASVPFLMACVIAARMLILGTMGFHYIFQAAVDPNQRTFNGYMEYFCRTVTIGMTQFVYGGNPEDTSIFQESTRILLPFVTWCLAHYAIAMIFYGEGGLKDIAVSAAFSFTPYIFFSWIGSAILTNVTTLGEKQLWFALSWIIRIWVFWLFFTHIRVIHDFTFRRTVATYVISLITVVIIWALLALVYGLTSNTYSFFYEIFYELTTR